MGCGESRPGGVTVTTGVEGEEKAEENQKQPLGETLVEKMTGDAEKIAKKRNKLIEAQIDQDRIKELTTVKVLLLGGPSSGKTTIFKQMRILHLNGFTESDYVNYRYIIHSNAVIGLQEVLYAAKTLQLSLGPLQVQLFTFFLSTLTATRIACWLT